MPETALEPEQPEQPALVTITLAEPWTYRTPRVTIEFPAGEHEVDADIAAAAPTEKETADGDWTAAPRAPRRAGKAEG